MRNIYLDVQEGARVIQGRFDIERSSYHVEYDRFSQVMVQCYIAESEEKRNKIEKGLIEYFQSEKGKKQIKDALFKMLQKTKREEKKKKIKWLLQQEERKEKLPKLEITDVSLSTKEFETDAAFAIFFKIENMTYSIHIENIGEKMVPMYIAHMHEGKEFCPCCKEVQNEELKVCFILSYHTKEVFNQLLIHPSIRLKMRFSSRNIERIN
jgi:hypothetical protein